MSSNGPDYIIDSHGIPRLLNKTTIMRNLVLHKHRLRNMATANDIYTPASPGKDTNKTKIDSQSIGHHHSYDKHMKNVINEKRKQILSKQID